MNKKPKGWIQDTRSTGVTWFGVLLTVGALFKIFLLFNYDYYRFLFQPLSDKAIFIRYVMSIAHIFLGLICGIGILILRDVFRKIAILLCFVTVLTVYWKHPVYVFRNVAVYIEHQYNGKTFGEEVEMSKEGYPLFKKGSSIYELEYESFPLISMSFYCIYDIVFCFAFIYFFNNKKVKEQFV
ncbi:MAG: hypothetical protein KKF78_00935 [Candidatus Omnitrophica bacterium]|nr:hypothetical protein [Candidatus Omnitrophota bacterium]MBU1995703.1 hypothetical protein [Candidatus Omnitrophota bacterium]